MDFDDFLKMTMGAHRRYSMSCLLKFLSAWAAYRRGIEKYASFVIYIRWQNSYCTDFF